MTDLIATTEATLCRVIAEVLSLELVGPGDGFFEVGGDSVLAVQVVARAREAGLALGVRDLFDHQTPEALAAVIDDRSAATGADGDIADSTALARSAAPVESPLLTFADDEFGEFGDDGADPHAGSAEGEWETIT
ncbi:phosphopantetheine-binding protein [Spirillospora sp. NPDC048911]|uniref:phosphopantetheine-binding protein n=1 Tax=Spirillospora sp. NPDC048911 TaxID=3364527 RepID=UPI00372429EB